MNGENSILVPTSVIETERPYGPYPAGTRWGQPDLVFAEESLRSLLDPERRGDVGRRGSESVRQVLSPAAVGAQAASLVRELLG
jgi:hypothetical protein